MILNHLNNWKPIAGRCFQLVAISFTIASVARVGHDSSEVRAFIFAHVLEHPKDVAKRVADRFGITRQAANRHLGRLVEEGLLVSEGQTRRRQYRPAVLGSVDVTIPIGAELQEDLLWRDHVSPLLRAVPENVRDVCNYGFTEMINNANDHSGSPTLTLAAEITAARIKLLVIDQGVGIFRKIKDALGLHDERHAILELAKGKFTTDPERHTGEGIFFTSRMFDCFAIGSGALALVHRRRFQDFLIREEIAREGTMAVMEIEARSTHTANEVFGRYASDQDDYAFQRTHVVVGLAEAEGDKLVSRSQAKRLVSRLERFREVVLDFRSVASIGPAFADEIFRVFRAAHPHVQLVPINANEDVERMIRRAESGGAS